MQENENKEGSSSVPLRPDRVLKEVYQKDEPYSEVTETLRKLEDAEERARLAIDAVGLGTFDLNLEKEEMVTSERFNYIFGFDRHVSHREFAAAVHPDDLHIRLQAHQDALTSGRLFYEARVIWKNGDVHWMRVEGKVYYNKDNRPQRILGTVLDFTDQYEATAGMRDSEERRMLIMNAALDAIICINTKGRITFWNPRAEKIFGWKAAEVQGEILSEIIIPEKFRSMHEKGIENYLKTGQSKSMNVILNLTALNRAGNEFPIELTVLAIKQRGEEFFCAFIRDITERFEIENALREREKKFRTLAESSPQKVWSCDNNGSITYVNSRMTDYTGLTIEENGDWSVFTHPDDYYNTESIWLNALEKGIPYEVEERFLRHDGVYHWHLTRGVPEKDSEGNVIMWIGTCTDIHEQKIMSEQLEKHVEERTRELSKVNEELKRTNQELEQFAYVASHDLQEPLRKIQTFSDFVINNYDKPGFNATQHLERINAAGLRMSALIKDLLIFSRVSKIDEQFVETDINLILENVINDFELLIREKNAVIKHEPLPVINAVPIQMNQLFYNLIGNSLKFSENQPLITINCKNILRQYGNSKKQYVQIIFSDNGIGFDQSYADKIFTIFQRLNTKDKYGGTGIGLAMCRKIVENHFGEISVFSKPNEGTVFYVTLPVK